ncbi:MAG: helix-turn-helix domain-containing protein [Chloroflexota bacterium]
MNITSNEPRLIDNQLWSIDRLAEYLDVPAATVKDWVYKRQIPFVKAGRHVRFKYSDVQKWLTEKGCGDGHQKD